MKSKYVQVLNPRTGQYMKLDKSRGTIISRKPTPGPYTGIPIADKHFRPDGKHNKNNN